MNLLEMEKLQLSLLLSEVMTTQSGFSFLASETTSTPSIKGLMNEERENSVKCETF